MFTAEGDMRQALNNLQATHSGFSLVNQARRSFRDSVSVLFDEAVLHGVTVSGPGMFCTANTVLQTCERCTWCFSRGRMADRPPHG